MSKRRSRPHLNRSQSVRRTPTADTVDAAMARRLAFKAAFIRLRVTQRAIAMLAKIPESRMSDIACSKGPPVTKVEREGICRATGLSARALHLAPPVHARRRVRQRTTASAA